jgi:hypothetical protein
MLGLPCPCRPWRFIRSRVAHVFSSEPAPAPALHLSASIATAGSSLTGVQSPAANAHTHACTASHAGLCTHYKDIASVPRYPLSGIDLSLKSLLGSITIQVRVPDTTPILVSASGRLQLCMPGRRPLSHCMYAVCGITVDANFIRLSVHAYGTPCHSLVVVVL